MRSRVPNCEACCGRITEDAIVLCLACADERNQTRAELDAAVEELLHCTTDYEAGRSAIVSRAKRVREIMKKVGK